MTVKSEEFCDPNRWQSHNHRLDIIVMQVFMDCAYWVWYKTFLVEMSDGLTKAKYEQKTKKWTHFQKYALMSCRGLRASRRHRRFNLRRTRGVMFLAY